MGYIIQKVLTILCLADYPVYLVSHSKIRDRSASLSVRAGSEISAAVWVPFFPSLYCPCLRGHWEVNICPFRPVGDGHASRQLPHSSLESDSVYSSLSLWLCCAEPRLILWPLLFRSFCALALVHGVPQAATHTHTRCQFQACFWPLTRSDGGAGAHPRGSSERWRPQWPRSAFQFPHLGTWCIHLVSERHNLRASRERP